VFVAATLPNLFLSPIAGTFVDRWDHREVLIVSDLLRAATVLLIPVVVFINVWLVYPLVFLITTISIFFRPARVAILPRLVRREDLLPANSAMWVGETLADVIGYPLAGLFVALLATSLPIAFWFDAVTYIVSALLMAAIAAPPLRRGLRAGVGDGRAGVGEGADGDVTAGDEAEPPRATVLEDLRIGWSFLRQETVLLANTIQGAAGQFAVGILTALAPVYAAQVLRSPIDPTAAYAFLETAIGVGNLMGGLVLGLVAARLARGKLVIAGYTFFGICVLGLGLVDALPAAIGLMLGVGITNMVFVIPSQTLFQERTPPDLIGRVVGFRFALVFGSMTIAMAVGGILAEFVGTAAVIVVAGIVSIIAGLSGLAVKSVRNA
jgi:MFS transporter, DHA3 family, macrolide efflux protein